MTFNISIKPQPVTDDQHYSVPCNKCSGTGFFCLGILNGQPYSNTGFECWNCKGKGWFIHAKKPTRQPAEPANSPWFQSSEKPRTWLAEMSELEGQGFVSGNTVKGPGGNFASLSEFIEDRDTDGGIASWKMTLKYHGNEFTFVIIND